ncbi:MAG: hypothetical protein SCK29_00065 [Bacillota bacterium]|nr:hypothetical protein [Bacillota bacterium]MDW7682494.1 hypothetical protein [Bacillota bacterium]
MKNFKWPVAVLAFILTLALSVGAVYLRQRQLVNEPLFKRISELEPVKTVELQQEDNTQVVVVSLEYVDDLAITHRELNEEINRLLGQKRYRLEIVDERNQALEAAFVAVHLSLYEGEHRGNFTEMGSQVKDTLKSMGISDHKVFVDSENIYLQIRDGDAYLYEIVKREKQGKDGEHV